MDILEELSIAIVDLEQEIETLEATVKDRKATLAETQKQLCELLIQQRLDGVKLTCGLSPRPKIRTDYFKASGTSDEQLLEWLKDKGLGGIIKPYVHFQTLQATLREYVDSGGTVPPILTERPVMTVVMGGRSKFLEKRNAGMSE